jgi:hypothetical protein
MGEQRPGDGRMTDPFSGTGRVFGERDGLVN